VTGTVCIAEGTGDIHCSEWSQAVPADHSGIGRLEAK
jgi:hypothetical protein